MLTAVLSSSDNVKSITFGTTTYNFSIGGLFPQITVTVPHRVTQTATDVPITITTDQVGSTTNIFDEYLHFSLSRRFKRDSHGQL